jgi:hypothetical protein
VVFLFRFLPETQGRELPQSLDDVNAWMADEKKTATASFSSVPSLMPTLSRKVLPALKSLLVDQASLRKCVRFVYRGCRAGVMSVVRHAGNALQIITRVSYVGVDGRSEAPV